MYILFYVKLHSRQSGICSKPSESKAVHKHASIFTYVFTMEMDGWMDGWMAMI